VDPRTGLDVTEKRKTPAFAENPTPTPQPSNDCHKFPWNFSTKDPVKEPLEGFYTRTSTIQPTVTKHISDAFVTRIANNIFEYH
jgi:hypothetical protein